MKDARLTTHGKLLLGLVFFLGGLPAANAQTVPPLLSLPGPKAPVLIGKIAHLRIVGSVNIPINDITHHITQKIGDFYSPAAAEKDQAALKDMGVFNAVDLSAVPSPTGGVDLWYTVAENPVVKSIKFTANTPTKEPTIPSGTLIALMKTRISQVLNTKVLVGDLDTLFNQSTGYVTKQGYLFGISSDINIDPPTGVLTIPLVEDHVQSIQITGNARIKAADILAQMHTKPGDLYNADALQKDLGAIYEMGEFKQVGSFAISETTAGQISVTIPVAEHEAATVDKLDEKQGKVIPFLYDSITRHPPVIQVSVNGKPSLPFVVDTGTGNALLLNPWAAARIGLKQQEPTEQGSGFRYATAPIQKAVFEGIDHANDVPFDINTATVADLSILDLAVPGKHIAGIVALGMLTPFTSRFDFATKTLTLFSYSHPPLHLPGAAVLPLRPTSDGRVTVHVTLTPETSADLILDTGSNSTGVPLAAVDALHLTAVSYGQSQGLEQIDGLYLCPNLRLSGLSLGTLRVPNVMVSATPLALPSLGMNILGNCRMTLDGPNAQLSLEPVAVVPPPVAGWSGINLRQTVSSCSVAGLRAGSPAQRAGLQVGDEIITINGRKVSGLPSEQFEGLFSGPLGTPLRVSLRRGQSKAKPGKLIDVSWVPLDAANRPHDALDGLVWKKIKGGPWVVISVLPGSPGEQAGLQAGDEVTRMGGEPVVDMSLDQFLAMMNQSREAVTLVVRRAGNTTPLSVKLISPPPPVPPRP